MQLDTLDRRIIGALQVDGRASWRRIAEVLEAPVSTVTRRGAMLLASGAVSVVASPTSTPTAIIEVTATPQRIESVARALAERRDTIFVYALSAPARLIVEEQQLATNTLANAVLREIPSIEGVTGTVAAPILEYYRTLTSWMPALLSRSEVSALNESFGRPTTQDPGPDAPLDSGIQTLLQRDGRTPAADIAAALEVPEAAVRRRLSSLLGTKLEVRAVVAPALLGLDVSAFLWIRVAPHLVPEVAQQIVASPFVRYAAMTMGEHQILVDVAVPTLEHLRSFLTDEPWNRAVESIRSSPVLAAFKRSGVPVAEKSS